MQIKFTRRNDNNRLILIYAGWSMDWRPFRNLHKDGYDIAVVWDYTTLDADWRRIGTRYAEICVIAWSMGVFAASVTMHPLLPRITKRIAVNGTLTPIHPTRGIPPAIFAGTLAGLSPSTLRKFQRRMCISAEQFAAFCQDKPHRTLEDLAAELQAIETHTIFHAPQVDRWDMAVVSAGDAIFGADNLLRAWHGKAPVMTVQGAHMPDFARLLATLVIDKNRVAQRFVRAAATYRDNAGAQRAIAARLLQHAYAAGMPRPGGHTIEVGVGDGTLTRLYAPAYGQGVLRLWDIAAIDPATAASAPQAIVRTEVCDAEIKMRRMPENSTDFILSSSTLQWFNSPASFLHDCHRTLGPGGWLAFSTFVRGNLPELTKTTGTALPLPDAAGWLAMLPADMDNVHTDTQDITLHFDTPRQVLEHLRATGVNGIDPGTAGTALARRLLTQMQPSATGSYTLTFKTLYVVARKTDNTCRYS